MIVWTPAVLSVLYACVLYLCICPCSAQLNMFHMERRSRNMLIIIIIITITECSPCFTGLLCGKPSSAWLELGWGLLLVPSLPVAFRSCFFLLTLSSICWRCCLIRSAGLMDWNRVDAPLMPVDPERIQVTGWGVVFLVFSFSWYADLKYSRLDLYSSCFPSLLVTRSH